MGKICAAYLRVSTHDQEEYSPDSQLRLIREYAEKKGMTLPECYVFRDDGVSGRSAEKRPGFQQMIAQARRKPRPFDCILVWKFSRFARNQEESVVYKSLLKKENGIEVVSISEPLLEGPYGGLIERVIEWFDAFYSANLAVEVRRGMEERLSRGLAVSGAPLGYAYRSGELVPVAGEAETVRLLFREFLRGVPLTTLARRLNTLGVRTKRGGIWENRAVRYVLENPVYVGKLRRRTDGGAPSVIPGKHPALICEAEFEAVQERLKAHRPSRPANQQGGCLLRGLVKCGVCGGTLSRTGKGMNCSRYAHGKCEVSHYIGEEKLEELVVAALRGQWGTLEFAPAIWEEDTRGDEEERLLQRRRRREREALRRCREAYAAGVDTLEEYRANKAAILKRLEELQGEPSPRPQPGPAAPQDALEILTEGPIEQRSRVLGALVDRIVYHKEDRTLEIFYAAPIAGEEDSHALR